MNKFAVVAKKDEISSQIEQKLIVNLEKNHWILEKDDPELVICVGGDGTFLYGVHKYLKNASKIAFLGIHTGTLGFFTDYTSEEVDQCIDDILHKNPKIEPMPLLAIQCNDQEPLYAVNEMRIENVIRTQVLDVMIDNVNFESFRGTGMCVSTQAGSTAYNRSLKGAVIDEKLSLMQLHEITGIHHHKYRSLGVPYIMHHDRVIEFYSDDFSDAILCYDQHHLRLIDIKKIKVWMDGTTICRAQYREISYLDRLKDLY